MSRAVIYNASGKNISTTILQNGDNIIDIKNFSRGVYIIKVLSDNDAKVYRINKL